jgi:ubiquinone biosynthesis protein UbiJ
MPDPLRRQTEDIIRYYGELNRRVAQAGMESIPRLLEVEKQLEMTVAEIAPQELAWATDEIRRLLDELVRMDSQLQRLRDLKEVIDGNPGRDEQGRRRPSL